MLVLGMGNLLRGDDGVGVRVAEWLLSEGVPPGVEVLDVGTAGLDITFLGDDVEHVVIVDAADFGAAPGTIRWFSLDEAPAEEGKALRSPHGMTVMDAIALARRLGVKARFWACGIQPDSMEFTMELSPAVSASVGNAANLVRRKVNELTSAKDKPPQRYGVWR